MDLRKPPEVGTFVLIRRLNFFIFEQNTDEPCVYKKCEQSMVMFLILYVHDILLIRNDIGALSTVKYWLANYFDMKDLGEASYILGIKLLRDRRNKMLDLSLGVYIDKILVKFVMHNFKKRLLPFRHGVPLYDRKVYLNYYSRWL